MDTHFKMCVGFGDFERLQPFSFLYNSKFVLMPNPTNLEQKRSIVTSTSTLTADVKALFILLMLVFTFINPILFCIPFVLCVLSMKKGGCAI